MSTPTARPTAWSVTPAAPPERPNARAILEALSALVSGREADAHEALQVGGYLPLDPDVPVEIPLSLCYAARDVLTPRCPTCGGFGFPRPVTDRGRICRTCEGQGRVRARTDTRPKDPGRARG